MKKEQKQTHPEVGEDATQYGEFVSSYFAWVPLPEQKEKAEKMSKMTKPQKRTDPLQGGTDPNCSATNCSKEEK